MNAPYLQDADLTIYQGDALSVLRELPDESVDCALTSPPFFGLRDYNVDGQIGLEATPEEWAAKLVAVFSETRRVLAPHGTLWIECGDSYGANTRAASPGADPSVAPNGWTGEQRTGYSNPYKPKDLMGTPFLLAFALRADGWWWRSTNIWAKPNALPESAKDRPAVAHSYVFQFAKQARYYHDGEAVREPAAWERWGAQSASKMDGIGAAKIPAKEKAEIVAGRDSRNLRSVWSIPTEGFPDAHFATWPQSLVDRLILMACPTQVCRVCGKPRERVVDVAYDNPGNRTTNGPRSIEARNDPLHSTVNSRGSRLEKRTSTTGWSSCECADYRPGIVLDPFLGSGTTALVARKHGRHAVGIELSPEYAEMAAKRLAQLSLLSEETA